MYPMNNKNQFIIHLIDDFISTMARISRFLITLIGCAVLLVFEAKLLVTYFESEEFSQINRAFSIEKAIGNDSDAIQQESDTLPGEMVNDATSEGSDETEEADAIPPVPTESSENPPKDQCGCEK